MSQAIELRPQDASFGLLDIAAQRKTSSEIIREARNALKTVHTKRPFTPKERGRTLFSHANGPERPPSSFTLSPLQFDSSEQSSRCSTSFLKRLFPLKDLHSFSEGQVVKLPGIHKASNRIQWVPLKSLSLTDLPEENEEAQEGDHIQDAASGPSRSKTIANLEDYQIHQDFQPSSESRNALFRMPSRKGFLTRLDPVTERQKTLVKRTDVRRDWRHAVETSKGEQNEGEKERGGESAREKAPMSKQQTEQAVLFEEKVAPLVDEILRASNCAGIDDSVLAELVDKLYTTLENENLLGRHFRYRTQVLKAIFKLVDREHSQLLAAITRIMLALKVSGSNLTSVCKLVFKVTRHDTNDALFMEGNLLDLLLEAVACITPVDNPEACIYGYGALKFLTMNLQIVARLLQRGILELLALHIKLALSHIREDGYLPKQTGYALVQLTGTLRHIGSSEKAYPLLTETGVLFQVCELLVKMVKDVDITANVVRVLSIVSTQEECCTAIIEHPEILSGSVAALKEYADQPGVVVRLAYALGNILANSNEARWNLFSVEGFTEVILDLVSQYLKRDREELHAELSDFLCAAGTPEDVLVKVVRVIANVSVHLKVGPLLAKSRTCLSLLISILRHKSMEESEELVLSTLAALNNLTFYTRTSSATSQHVELAECLCDLLPMNQVDGLIETVRVFGNLTHFKETRDILSQKEVLELLVEMLDCDSRELVYVCAGVLVNMMSDASKRSIFSQENGVLRMIDVLQYFGYGDWQLCTLVCQVLWNYCASSADVYDALGAKEAYKLAVVLEEFLDDEAFFNNPEMMANWQLNEVATYQLWEDFAQVAEKLLHRIDSSPNGFPVVGKT